MKTHWLHSLTQLTDEALLTRVHELAQRERRTTVDLIAHLAEMDERRLHLTEGCSSLFTYCTEVLHFSEHAAYNRIECARAARRFPLVFERLADGSVHLTAVRLLSPHLTPDNHAKLLDGARHMGRRGIEAMISLIRPLPDVPSVVRRLPTRGEPAATSQIGLGEGPVRTSDHQTVIVDGPVRATASRPSIVAPLAPERYRVQFTADQEMHEDLKAATEMLRHQVPNGDPAIVLKLALRVLVRELQRKKFAATTRPRRSAETIDCPSVSRDNPDRTSRHIPAAVRREVARRDDNRCAFRSRDGRRCAARGQLEFHHIQPFSLGGRATRDDISLRCRAHNAHEARRALVREPAATYVIADSPGQVVRGVLYTSPISNSFRNELSYLGHHGPS